MCDVIMTENGDVDSPAEMNARGWTVMTDDIEPDYLDVYPFEDLIADSCLCPIKVEQVLDRHGVEWTADPFGYCVAPLAGKW